MTSSKKPDEPQVTTAATEDDDAAPFVDDVIIWAEGLDAPRRLTQDALRQLPAVPPSLMPPINSLIKQGVTIATIPTTSGIGASCYLVNLATLKRPDHEETSNEQTDSKTATTAAKSDKGS